MAAISHALIKALNVGFDKSFQEGVGNAESQYLKITTVTKSNTSSTTYGWLGKWPAMREWIGARVIQDISNSGYSIVNKKYESTIGVDRVDIDDDNVGIYAPLFEEMGREGASFPDQLVGALLAAGDKTPCYDGQNFFDAEHPVYENHDGTGTAKMVSNITEGDGSPWFVLDCSRSIKPVIYQERDALEMTAMDKVDDENVFTFDQFRYGTRVRCNVGVGFWQMAHMSKAELNAENLWDVIQKMRQIQGDGGKRLGIKPTILVVSPDREKEARRLLERELDSASSNELKGRLELMVYDYL